MGFGVERRTVRISISGGEGLLGWRMRCELVTKGYGGLRRARGGGVRDWGFEGLMEDECGFRCWW